MNICLIEDNDMLRQATVALLARHGHWTMGLVCAEDVDDMSFNPSPDLFLIDLNLPGEDGLSLTRRLRAAQPLVGIIIMTARTELQDKVAGYESGADLYLPKPVDPMELLAAVDSVERRLQQNRTLLRFSSDTPSELCLDQRSRMLQGQHGQESLSEKETAILVGLSRAQGHLLESWQIMVTAGEDPATYAKSSLEVRMLRLRQKISKVSGIERCLPAVRGYGYQLAVSVMVI